MKRVTDARIKAAIDAFIFVASLGLIVLALAPASRILFGWPWLGKL